ncbi:MAG: hypothetical protein ACD_19C00021G0014 [uncultured bacterium]|nr:MAG: hypothetical protein ACD_19C00021G0014 [uncultured bacterium]
MTKTQTSSSLPPRISMFDKKGQANLSRFTKIPNISQKSERVSIPTVRINQHKGA